MKYIASSLDSSSSSNNEKLLDEIDVKHQIAVQAIITCVNIWEFFTPMELEEGGGQYTDLNISVTTLTLGSRLNVKCKGP
jgi:hypothetical protein